MNVIMYHQAVMAHAAWIIDLGPGAGQDGGIVLDVTSGFGWRGGPRFGRDYPAVYADV